MAFLAAASAVYHPVEQSGVMVGRNHPLEDQGVSVQIMGALDRVPVLVVEALIVGVVMMAALPVVGDQWVRTMAVHPWVGPVVAAMAYQVPVAEVWDRITGVVFADPAAGAACLAWMVVAGSRPLLE